MTEAADRWSVTASRLQAVTDAESSAEYQYVANNQLVDQIIFRNGEAMRMTTVKKYDRLNRLLSIASQPSADSPISYTYAYNLANQRTKVVMADGGGWDYGYDVLCRLTNAVRFNGKREPLPNGVYQYAYDDIGNRTKAINAGVEVDYQADALNRYTNSVARNAGAPYNVTSSMARSWDPEYTHLSWGYDIHVP